MENGYPARAITSPFRLPPSLAAPKAVPPPSTLPTDRLATQADQWASGRGDSVSPALPPPRGYDLNPKPASSSINSLVTQTLINQASIVAAQQQQPQEPPQPPPGPPPTLLLQSIQPSPIVDMNYNYHAPPPHTQPQQQQQMMMNDYPQQQQQPMYMGGPAMHQQPPAPMSYGQPLPSMPIPPQQQATPYYALPQQQRLSGQYNPALGSPQQPMYQQQQQQARPYTPQQPLPPLQPNYGGPPQSNYYPSGPPSLQQSPSQPGSGFVQRPPRTASVAMNEYPGPPTTLEQLSLGASGASSSQSAPPFQAQLSSSAPSNSNRPLHWYASEQDAPPHKLSVTHPDQRMLVQMRETAFAAPSDMSKKVAWAKQVLKFIERQQARAGESSRITDPVLVRWTDEALNLILSSASSPTPVPLALYLRGDLASSGSFPSYRSKDAKSAFRDFEAAANLGLVKSWFRLGRAYEDAKDFRRAVNAYERGIEKSDCGCSYRLGMAYLLGDIGLGVDLGKAIALLRRAADTADLDTPQPPHILGLILCGEFENNGVKITQDMIAPNIDEARWRIERSAYLAFGPAQYKMGFAYEYATLGCLFDPLLSVGYYALASQNGEIEADMALSKWYLCGSEGNFDKNEALAVTFAEKAASRGLSSAEFALGYFAEVGIASPINLELARRLYQRAASHGNDDAQQRLDALTKSDKNGLSRVDHESQLDQKLVRKRTQAQVRSNEQRARLAQTQSRIIANGASQQPVYHQQSPPHHSASVPIPNHNAYNPHPPAPNTPGRQSTMPPQQQSVNTRKRRDTLKYVEAAAAAQGWGPRPMPAGRTSVDGGRPSSQRPSTTGPNSNSVPSNHQGESIQVKQRPATFAEMGIATSKAKKDECLIM